MIARDTEVRRFKFGALNVAVKGLGVYFGGEHLNRAVAALTAEQAQEANREAWKQRRAATRTANRFSNVTIHGWRPYEEASLHAAVAEAVCKATWKRMCETGGVGMTPANWPFTRLPHPVPAEPPAPLPPAPF